MRVLSAGYILANAGVGGETEAPTGVPRSGVVKDQVLLRISRVLSFLGAAGNVTAWSWHASTHVPISRPTSNATPSGYCSGGGPERRMAANTGRTCMVQRCRDGKASEPSAGQRRLRWHPTPSKSPWHFVDEMTTRSNVPVQRGQHHTILPSFGLWLEELANNNPDPG